MICAMSKAHTTVLDGGEYAQFKAEKIDRPDMPYCPKCDCRHDYDGRPYCDTLQRYFSWRGAQKEHRK